MVERNLDVQRPGVTRTTTPLASYRLGRAALDQRQFLAVELAALAEVPMNTVYGFLADLGPRVTSETLASSRPGRPRKLYALTDEGIDYLLDRNLEIARTLRVGSDAGRGRGPAPAGEGPARVKGTLHDAFVNELHGMYDAERQYARTLPTLGEAATARRLRAAFEVRLEETKRHIQRLEQLFERFDEKVRGRHSDGIAAILEEGRVAINEGFDEATLDACLIAAGQRATHYAMASYGTLVAWATIMGHTELAELLQTLLDEEKAADEQFAAIAAERCAQEAPGAADDEDEAQQARRHQRTAAVVKGR